MTTQIQPEFVLALIAVALVICVLLRGLGRRPTPVTPPTGSQDPESTLRPLHHDPDAHGC